ncbi:MAG: hypothetical protein K6F73_08275 [Lachnospiraceae bacterium]|nr:hypothetical protein [Lachnospiraceae bacterium]
MFYNRVMENDHDDKAVDVICQHSRDGAIIPMKVRLTDEDGQVQAYKIRSYRDMSHKGRFQMPNGVVATSGVFPFECRISCFGNEKTITLVYFAYDHVWRISSPGRTG